jgi:hypothetical protein
MRDTDLIAVIYPGILSVLAEMISGTSIEILCMVYIFKSRIGHQPDVFHPKSVRIAKY